MREKVFVPTQSWVVFVIILFCLSFGSELVEASVRTGGAEAKAREREIIRTMESVSGEISGLNSSFINLVYERSGSEEFEMYLPLDQRVKLDHYKRFSDVLVGDRVELQYEKAVEAPGTPEERITMTVKRIRFVKRPKQNELRSEEKGS